jgi:hypothetical protein
MIGLPLFKDGDVLFVPGGAAELFDGVQALATALGTLAKDHLPADRAVLQRVGEVRVLPLADPAPYLVERAAEPVAKPDVGRAPDAKPGTMAVQSLIFDSGQFTAAQARQWIKDHPEYGDYGVDETAQSLRFRQYDTEHFTRFRTKPFTDGVTAVLGVVKAAGEGDGWGVRLLEHEVRKAADGSEERFALSLVLEPNDGAEPDAPLAPDTQGDVYSAEEIRKTCHGWMEKGAMVDVQHNWKALAPEQVRVVENYLAPVPFTLGDYPVRKGSWLLGLRILDERLWAAVKDGTIGAFSVGGSAVRRPVEE